MYHKIEICFISIILSFLYSCKKDIKPTFNSVSQFEHDFIGFKPGTYWIYEDDSTLSLDTFFVYKLDYGQENRRNKNGDIIVYYDFVESHLKRNGNYNNGNNRFGVSEDHGYYIFDDWNVSFNFTNTSIIGKMPEDTIRHFTTWAIDSATFTNVYQIITSNVLKPVERVEVYTAQKIGIIKYLIKYKDGHTENKKLIRYFIQP